jgi:hypothetical protein
MALATEDDVAAALGRTPDSDVETLLEEASDLVAGYLGCPTLDPVPPAVSRVVASMVASALNRAPGMAGIAPGDSLTAGPYTVRSGDSSSGTVWLTNGLKMRLRPYRCGSSVSVALESELYPRDDVWDWEEGS